MVRARSPAAADSGSGGTGMDDLDSQIFGAGGELGILKAFVE